MMTDFNSGLLTMSKTSLQASAQGAKDALRSFQDLITPVIEDYFEEQLKKTRILFTSHAVKAVEVFNDYTHRGGKRLRGSLVYYVYKMYGGTDLKEALKMCLVIELVHSYALAIDDFMDISPKRRRGPSAHVMFMDYFKEQGFKGENSAHFGNSMAVLTGLTGFHIAMQLLNSLGFSDTIKVKLSNYLNKNTEVTAYGQITDVINAVLGSVAEEDVINTLKWKTGVYTYQNPIHNGAIMAGVTDEKELDTLTNYAIPAGIAFQIQDDILGTFGNEEDLGKAVTDDLKEGKYTLLIHKALEFGNEQQKAILKKALGNKNITDAEHEEVKKVFEDTGSLQYSRDLAKKFVIQAKDALRQGYNPAWQKEGLDYLNGIADYMIERNV